MTEAMTKRIQLSEHPRAYLALTFVEGLFKKNTELFQFAFGSILLTSAINIMFKANGQLTREIKNNLLILGIFFLLYVAFIILKWWKDHLENKNLVVSHTIAQYDKFLGTYGKWLQDEAERIAIKDYEKAIAFLQLGTSLFGVTSTSEIDKKLATMYMFIQDSIFHTKKAMLDSDDGSNIETAPTTPTTESPNLELEGS